MAFRESSKGVLPPLTTPQDGGYEMENENFVAIAKKMMGNEKIVMVNKNLLQK